MPEFTIAEASQRLGISTDTIRRRIARGELQARKTSSSHGEIYLVELPEEAAPAADPELNSHTAATPTMTTVQNPETEALKNTIIILETELEARRREIKELHILLQQAQTAALPAVRRQDLRRPWWSRLFK